VTNKNMPCNTVSLSNRRPAESRPLFGTRGGLIMNTQERKGSNDSLSVNDRSRATSNIRNLLQILDAALEMSAEAINEDECSLDGQSSNTQSDIQSRKL